MRKIFLLFLLSVLLCSLFFTNACAENENNYHGLGWGFALGVRSFTQSNFEYEATSIGDIKFPCHMNGISLSVFSPGMWLKNRRKVFYQLEAGMNWLEENGRANFSLQKYPATVESKMQEVGIGFGVKLSYLQKGNIWLSSGMDAYMGFNREHFNIYQPRGGHTINVFNPKAQSSLDVSIGFVLLSLAIIDNTWDSWEVQFGYGLMGTERDNGFKRFSIRDSRAESNANGWYFQIRKLIPVVLKKQKSVEEEVEKEEEKIEK